MRRLLTQLLALHLVVAAHASAQLRVAPTMLFVDDDAPFGTLLVSNPGERDQEVTVGFRFGHPATDSLGNVDMVYGDSLPAASRSLQPWVRAFPRQFRLGPGEQQTVRVAVRAPEDIGPGMFWTRVVLTSMPRSPAVDTAAGGVRAQVVFRIEQVTTLLYRKGDLRTDPTVERLEADVDTGAVNVYATLGRGGNAPFLGTATVEITDSSGAVVARDFEVMAMYVDMVRRFAFDRSGLAPGEYTAELTLESRRNDIAPTDIVQILPVVARTRFTVP